MEYEIMDKPGFKIMGLSMWTINKDGIVVTDTYNLWQRWLENNVIDQIPGRVNENIYNLYCDYESGESGRYMILLGCTVRSIDRIPGGLTGRRFPKSKYAVFNYHGKLPYVVMDVWNYIRRKADFERTYMADFDIYPSGNYDPKNAYVTTCVSIK